MQRFTITIDEDLLGALDAVMQRRGYSSRSEAVRGLADALTAQRGVRHANLHVVPVELSEDQHRHGGRETAHPHLHA